MFKFENLNENFNILCNKIGVSGVPLQHKNKTSHKFYTEYYDEEAIEIVRTAYSDDIEMFGYNFM